LYNRGCEEMDGRFNVNIAGYALTITTERSAEHMERLSELLNERVREVQKTGGTANYLHVILVAAMKLGDEILELREQLEKEKGRFEEKSQDLLTVLDKALK
jgi:cell division protein ZapA (FtsZ GTPase activity inhibitor)